MQNETWTYDDFAQRAEDLLAPLRDLMVPGASTIPIEGLPSDHGEAADRFEAFARPCLLAALWLRSTRHTAPSGAIGDPESIAAWFREGLVLGTDPSSDQFWGVLSSFHQFAVEMAILVMAIDIADEHLWDPLSPAEREQVAAWLGQLRGHAGHHNNHLFFDLLVLEFLGTHGFGHPEDGPCVDWLFDELEQMHRADGWFIDGTNETYDHYNAYAFHIYGLYWVWRYGDHNAERAARWKRWAAAFIECYARFFSSSGEPIPFGRSLTYRFNGVGVFGLAALLEIDSVDPGVMRRICRKCIEFFLTKPITQSQGCLSLGWTDHFDQLAEPYSCAGSPYWAAKGFTPLLLDPDHPFFTAPEKPMPSETETPPAVVRAPGFVVRNVNGEVELINAGGWSSFSAAARFGQWKWGRLGYRTGTGSLLSEHPLRSPPDAGLTAARPGTDEWFGRHKTIPVCVEPDHIATAYTLSAQKSGFNVSVVTDAWWNEGWLLCVHRVCCAQPTVLRSGGYALALEPGTEIGVDHRPDWIVVSSGSHASAAQPIAGWHTTDALRREPSEPRRHLYAEDHAVPVLVTAPLQGDHLMAELLWCGERPAPNGPLPIAVEPGRWRMPDAQPHGWIIEHASLPDLAVQPVV